MASATGFSKSDLTSDCTMEGPDESLLAIIFDTNMSSLAAAGEDIGAVIDSVFTFCNAHLMLSSSNRLCLLASHVGSNQLLFPDDSSASDTSGVDGSHGHFEQFGRCSRQLCERLKDRLIQSQETPIAGSCVAAGLASCLCHINRQRQATPAGSRLHSRMLVVSAHGTVASQYMDFMNVFFTAQKLDVPLDACLLAVESGVLRQGADITGGVCLHVEHVRGLLQYLLWLFLPDVKQRPQLTLPAPQLVDYRAACFCHRQLISVGYVCSVCLSIFCKYAPVCSTCHTVFTSGAPPPPRASKKRKK